MKKAKIIIVLTLLALFLRLWQVNIEPLWLDEVISIRFVVNDFGAMFEMIENDVQMPLHVTLLFFWIRFFGISELSVRAMSVIFGTLCIPLTYLLAEKIFNKRIAVISTILVTLSPIHIYYSQEARPYALLIFLTLCSFYFFLHHGNRFSLYIASSTLMIYTHLFGVLCLLVQNLYLILQKKLSVKWIRSQTLILALFSPWFIILKEQLKNSVNISWIQDPNLLLVLYDLIKLFGNPVVFVIFCSVLLISIESTRDQKLLLLWIVLPFSAVLLFSRIFSPMYHIRYMLITFPAFMLLFSYSLKQAGKYWKVLFFIVCLFLSLSLLEKKYTLQRGNWPALVDYLDGKKGWIFVEPYYQQDTFTYYFDTFCFRQENLNTCNFRSNNVLSVKWLEQCCNDSTDVTSTDKTKLGYYTKHDIWLVSVRPDVYKENLLFDYFSSKKDLQLQKSFGNGIKLYHFT